MGRSHSLEDARRFFAEYKNANSDLPAPTLEVMVRLAAGRRFPVRILRQILGGPVGQFYTWARGFFLWNALQLSGLAEEWGWMVRAHNEEHKPGGAILLELRSKIGASSEQWKTLLRRLGHFDIVDDSRKQRKRIMQGHRSSGYVLWTKGGDWRITSNYTRLLILKEPLGPRVCWRPFQRALVACGGVEQVERELMQLVDPDRMLAPEVIRFAHGYVRQRIPQILRWAAKGNTIGGLGSKRLGEEWLPWFWKQTVILHGTAYPYSPHRRRMVRKAVRHHGEPLTPESI